jgi:Carboxypeptidase regulatory-like domain/Domain of unknown function (DUF3244)
MKMKIFLASLTLVASVVSSAAIAAATPVHLSSVIGGRVVDSITHRPLGGVQVDVFDDANGSHPGRAIVTTVTNQHGNFSLLGLRSGTYHLELAKRGYALEIVTGLSVRPDERILIGQPFGMRTAIVTTGIGQAMETHL